jgi:hypothetical protein
MFQEFIVIIRWSYYLRSYSSNICVVDVYGLQFAQCGQLARDAPASLDNWPHRTIYDPYTSTTQILLE